MSDTKFEIYDAETESSTDKKYLSVFHDYEIKKIVNGNTIFSGKTSLYSILKGKSELPKEDYNYVYDAIIEYLDAHNESIDKINKNISFKILEIDQRYAAKYEEYMGDKLIKEGVGWAKDLKTKEEKKAWESAIKEFKKSNKIESSTDKLKKHVDEINEAIDSLDGELPELDSLVPPLIETAIPMLLVDPCNFVSELNKAAQVSISRINGIPNPTELANYYIKLGKNNIKTLASNALKSSKETVAAASFPITSQIEKAYEYFEQLDSEREEFLKENSETYYTFKAVMAKEVETGGTMSSFTSPAEEVTMSADYSNINANVESSKVITFSEIAKTGKTVTAKKSFSKTYGGKTYTGTAGHSYRNEAPTPEITNRIYEGMRNLWIPLRLAWAVYCEEKGWKNPTWIITSGYRCPIYNFAVGSGVTSAHMTGWAIDVVPANGKVKELGDFIYAYCKDKSHGVVFDQLLREVDAKGTSWVHIGYKSNSGQRGEYSPYYTSYKKTDRQWKYLA